MKRFFAYGGVIASAVLIVFGVGSIVVGAMGVNEVRDTLAREQIVGGDDEFYAAQGIVGAKIDTGSEAKKFAAVMREHMLESSSGLTYAQMGRFVSAANPDDPKGTSDEAAALKDESGKPVANAARNQWVTETALTTALNTSFFAERVALFSIAMGGMLLLTGIGFLVLTLGGALGFVPVPKRVAAPKATPVAT
jgi:hypothetical protein